MKRMLTIGLWLCLLSGASMTTHADDSQTQTQTRTLISQCVATFIHQGLREDVVLWKGMFQLDNDEILFFVKMLHQGEAEGDLSDELLVAAVDSCRAIYRNVQSMDEAPSQASGVDGSG